MPTYPLSTLAPTVDSTGISAPSYNDILLSLQASFKQIYGSDIVISADSQDGQWIAVLAKAINDNNQVAIQIFNAISPDFAQGAHLSSLVKLSAISRNIPTNSTAVGNVVGVVGTLIQDGIVRDASGNLWNLPPSVTIPLSGSISVTVTAQESGAIAAQIGDINQIANPQYGWQSFTNTSAAVLGAPVETDAALRRRAAVSASLPALGIIEAISAAVGNVLGVTRWTVYENATGTTDTNGIPAHAFCVVVEGGTTATIAAAIQRRKPPGIQTFGNTAVPVIDSIGLASTINYSTLGYFNVWVNITVQALSGYTAAAGTDLTNAIVAFINALVIGEDVYYTRVSAAASLIGTADGETYYITALTLCPVAFTGSISGNTLTVSAMAAGSAPLAIGQTIFGAGVTDTIAGLGTGTGGVGTYILSGSHSIASEAMTAAPSAGLANLTVPFDQAAKTAVANINLTVLP